MEQEINSEAEAQAKRREERLKVADVPPKQAEPETPSQAEPKASTNDKPSKKPSWWKFWE